MFTGKCEVCQPRKRVWIILRVSIARTFAGSNRKQDGGLICVSENAGSTPAQKAGNDDVDLNAHDIGAIFPREIRMRDQQGDKAVQSAP
jgi:hypothetical protein